MIQLLATGAVSAKPLTTHVYPLAHVDEAFRALERREAVRPSSPCDPADAGRDAQYNP
jgi:Zn-dependent alcohol dehydrogenase